MDDAAALRATRAWVEHAVIGLNLCPFAKAVQTKNLIRYVCSDAPDNAALLEALRSELQRLADTPMDELETTLLVHPQVLGDFLAIEANFDNRLRGTISNATGGDNQPMIFWPNG